MENHCCSSYYLAYAVYKRAAGRSTTEQMCIIFAACFILRDRDTHIDFLRFISGRHDFLSDANREHFL